MGTVEDLKKGFSFLFCSSILIIVIQEWRTHALCTMAILFVYREQKEQLQKMKDYGSEPQMPDHLPPQDSRLQNTSSRPGMYPVWENMCPENEMVLTLYVCMSFDFFFVLQ